MVLCKLKNGNIFVGILSYFRRRSSVTRDCFDSQPGNPKSCRNLGGSIICQDW